jgi:hypothetical protein
VKFFHSSYCQHVLSSFFSLVLQVLLFMEFVVLLISSFLLQSQILYLIVSRMNHSPSDVSLKNISHGTCSIFHFREMVEAPWCVNRRASGTRLELLALVLAVVVTTLLGCTQECPCMNSGLQTLSYATRADISVSEIVNSYYAPLPVSGVSIHTHTRWPRKSLLAVCLLLVS